jgi:uncharacterized protein YjbI with pentapeptide repeats
MKRTLAALTVTASLMASGASAYDSDHLQKLKDTNECINCDLRYADLRYADLSGADLSGANLSRASLLDVNLTGADLTGANLAGADLTGANLGGADLSGAKLAGIYVLETTIFCDTTMPDRIVVSTSNC